MWRAVAVFLFIIEEGDACMTMYHMEVYAYVYIHTHIYICMYIYIYIYIYIACVHVGVHFKMIFCAVLIADKSWKGNDSFLDTVEIPMF